MRARDSHGFDACERCSVREATVVINTREVCSSCEDDELIDQSEVPPGVGRVTNRSLKDAMIAMDITLVSGTCQECSHPFTCDETLLHAVTCSDCGEPAAHRCADCGDAFIPVAGETLCEYPCAEDARRFADREHRRAVAEGRGDYMRERQREAR